MFQHAAAISDAISPATPRRTYRWIENTGTPWFHGTANSVASWAPRIDIDDRKHGAFTPDEAAVRLVFSLTERERQVLVLIAGGKSTKEDGPHTWHQL